MIAGSLTSGALPWPKTRSNSGIKRMLGGKWLHLASQNVALKCLNSKNIPMRKLFLCREREASQMNFPRKPQTLKLNKPCELEGSA